MTPGTRSRRAQIVWATLALLVVSGSDRSKGEGAQWDHAPSRAATATLAPLPGPRRFQFARSLDDALARNEEPSAVGHGPDGVLVVADRASESVLRLDRAGRLLDRQWADSEEGGPYTWKVDLAIGWDGRTLLLGRNARVHRTDARGRHEPSFEVASGSTALALLPEGDLLVAHDSGVVYRHGPDGQLRGTWVAGLGWPAGIAVDAEHGVWVADLQARRVLHFDLEGRLLGGLPADGAPWPVHYRPTDVAIGPAGQLAVAFAEQDAVMVSWPAGAAFAYHPVRAPSRLSYGSDGTLVLVAQGRSGQAILLRMGGAGHVAPFAKRYDDLGRIVDLASTRDGVLALREGGLAAYTARGERLATWSPESMGSVESARVPGRALDGLHTLAVTPDGMRWIAGARTLVRVSAGGTLRGSVAWSDLLGGGQGRSEIALAVSADGSVVAADPARAVLARLTAQGAVAAVGSAPALKGLSQLSMVELSDGMLAIVHPDFPGVMRLQADGGTGSPWSLPGDAQPVDIALDVGDGVVIADARGRRLIRLDASGRLRAIVALEDRPQALVNGEDDVLFVGTETRISRRRSSGALEFGWGSLGRAASYIGGIDVAPDGAVALAVAEGRGIWRFDPHGNFISGWPTDPIDLGADLQRVGSELAVVGSAGVSLAATAGAPTRGGLVVDATGRHCALRIDRGAVLCFSDDGRLVERIGGGLPGESFGFDFFTWGGDVAIAADGTMWIAEPRADRVTGLRRNGQVVRIGGGGQGAGSLEWPVGVAVAEDGSVLVTDRGPGRLQRFTPDGELMAVIGPPTGAPGALVRPHGLTVRRGVIDVADPGGPAIRRFALDGGAWLGDWGHQSAWMHDLAWSDAGRAYVATGAGVDVYDEAPHPPWIASLYAEPWQRAGDPVWRATTDAPRLPGLGPSGLMQVVDPRWRFEAPLSVAGDRSRLWQLDARGRVELRIDGQPIFFRDPARAVHTTYAGLLPSPGQAGSFPTEARVTLDYAPGGQDALVALDWRPWEVAGRAHLPVVVR